MNSKEFPIKANELDIADLEPTQNQLATLHESIVAREAYVEPFDNLPSEISMEDMARMEIYSDGAQYDESLAPAALFKTPDGRVLWLSVFRNPDTNSIVKETITIEEPLVDRELREETSSESYALVINNDGKFDLTINGTIEAKKPEVEYIQTLLDISEPFNPFDI